MLLCYISLNHDTLYLLFKKNIVFIYVSPITVVRVLMCPGEPACGVRVCEHIYGGQTLTQVLFFRSHSP